MFRRFARREVPEPVALPPSGTCNYCSTRTDVHVKIEKFQVWACRLHVDLALDTFNGMRQTSGHH